MLLLTTKTTNFEMKEFLTEARIPTMYFKRHEDPSFVNNQVYLPAEMYAAANVKKALGVTNINTMQPPPNAANNATSAITDNATNATNRKLRSRPASKQEETDVSVSKPNSECQNLPSLP